MAHFNSAGGAAGLALLSLFSAGFFVGHCYSFSHGSFAKPPAQSSIRASGRHSPSFSPRPAAEAPAALSMAEASRPSAGEGARHGNKRVFIFGIGYTGFGLVRAAQEKWGDDVMLFGTCRSEGKVGALRSAGVVPHIFNPDDEYKPLEGAALDDLMSATHIVTTIPAVADFNRDPVLEFHAKDIARSESLVWAGYVSTTGVYGDHKGAWVDESSETLIQPGHRSYSRLEAERAWMALSPQVPSHIFRLAGIYGPCRSALDTVRRSEASKNADSGRGSRRGYKGDEGGGEDKYVSRCHVSDICQALLASMDSPVTTGRVYNVADDVPAKRREVMMYARSLLGLVEGQGREVGEEAPTPGGRRASSDNKRVSNGRLRTELGVKLRYPSYKEGLDAIYAGVTDPFVTE